MADGGIDHGVADDGVALLDRIPVNGSLGHATGEDRDLLHATQGLFSPGDRVFRLRIDRRHVFPIRHEDVTRGATKEILRVASDIHILVAMDTDAADDQESRDILAHILDNLFERFAVEQCRLDVSLFGLGDLTRNIEMRLIDLCKATVDHFFVQLFLLFETEHRAGFFVQHAGNAVERGIVEIWIEGGNGFDRHIEGFAEGETSYQPAKGIGAAVHGHDDLAARHRLSILNDQHVGVANATDDPLRVTADDAIFYRTDPQGSHDDEVVGIGIDIFSQHLPVASFEGPPFD